MVQPKPWQWPMESRAPLQRLKGLISSFSPFCGIILQVHPVFLFSVWQKNLAAPQVEPGGINKTMCPSTACMAIFQISRVSWKRGTERTLRKPAHPHNCRAEWTVTKLFFHLPSSPGPSIPGFAALTLVSMAVIWRRRHAVHVVPLIKKYTKFQAWTVQLQISAAQLAPAAKICLPWTCCYCLNSPCLFCSWGILSPLFNCIYPDPGHLKRPYLMKSFVLVGLRPNRRKCQMPGYTARQSKHSKNYTLPHLNCAMSFKLLKRRKIILLLYLIL